MQASSNVGQTAFYGQILESFRPALRQKLLRVDLRALLQHIPTASPNVLDKLGSGDNRLAIETLLTQVKTENLWSDFFKALKQHPELATFCTNFESQPREEPAPQPRVERGNHIPYMRVEDGVYYDHAGNVIPGRQAARGTSVGILIENCEGVEFSDVTVDGVRFNPRNPT